MSIESWQPVQASTTIDNDAKQNLLAQAEQFTQSEYDVASLTADQLSSVAQLMQAKKEAWVELAANLSDSELEQCIRILTIVEEKQNLGLAERSPVIVLFKQYKKLAGINRELVKWVKENNENKFLPFGPIM